MNPTVGSFGGSEPTTLETQHSLDNVKPNRRALSEWAIDRLQDAIFTGELSSGTQLFEDEITQRLGISRTPLREALKKLEVQGLVEVNTSTGRRVVVSFDSADIYALYTIRSTLEELAVARAATYGSSALVERLSRLQDKMDSTEIDRSHPRARDFGADFDLHREIAVAAGMPKLISVLEPLWAQTHTLIRGLFTAGLYGDAAEDRAAYRDHRRIIAALASEDAEAGADAMRQHLHGRRDALLLSVATRTSE